VNTDSNIAVFLDTLGNLAARLRFYWTDTLAFLGETTVVLRGPMADRLVRWGTQGLALLANEQIHVITTSLLPKEPPTDLAVALEWRSSGADELRVRVTWINSGANPVVGGVGTLRVSGNVLLEASPGVPWVDIQPQNARLALPDLEPGSRWTTEIVATRLNPLPVVVVARGHSANREIHPANNRAILAAISAIPHDEATVRVPLNASDLNYVPKFRTLVGTLGADDWSQDPLLALVAFNPWTHQVVTTAFPRGRPQRIAVSPNGQYLLVSSDDGQLVDRHRLPDLAWERRITSAPSPYPELTDLAIAPGDGRISALARGGQIEIFDDDLPRIPVVPEGHFATRIAFGEDAQRLWAIGNPASDLEVRRFRLDSSGAHLEAQRSGLIQPNGGEFRIRGHQLFSSGGDVLDRESLERISLLSEAPPPPAFVAVDDLPGRVILASPGTSFCSVYGADSLELLGTIEPPLVGERSKALVRWGAEGLGILDAAGLWLIRSPLLAPAPNADSDADGLPDAWELDGGLDPRRPDAGEDADGDGQTNEQEWLAGTDPRDAASRLQIQLLPDGALQFFGRSGRRYGLETVHDLGAAWIPLEAVWVGSDALIETAPFSPSAPLTFVRLRILP